MALTLSNTLLKWEGGSIFTWQRNIDFSPTTPALFGTYDGTDPTSLQFSLSGSTFIDLENQVIGSGLWSATLPAMAAAEGILVIRRANATSDTASYYFCLGDVWLIIGDSIAVGAHVNNLLSSATPKHTRYLHNAAYWVELDTTSGGPDSGSWPVMMSLLTAMTNAPQLFINAASSGSTMAAWTSGDARFDNAMATVAASKVNNLRGILIHSMINDVRAGGHAPAFYTAGMQTVRDNLTANLPVGSTAPLIWASPGPCDMTSGISIAIELDTARQGWLDGITAGSALAGPMMYHMTFPDSLHPDNSNSTELGGLWFLSVADPVFGATYGATAHVTAVTVDATATVFDITASRGMANAPGSAMVGTVIKDGFGSVQTMVGATEVIVAPNKWRVTLATPVTGTPTVSYVSGNACVGATIARQAAETLPNAATIQRPFEFFFDHAVTATPSGGGGGSIFAGCVR